MEAVAESPRLSMPGVCGPEGSAVHLFVESDGQSELTETVAEAAAFACRKVCSQIDHCRAQAGPISRSLHVAGVEFPVVGGEIIPRDDDTRYLTPRQVLAEEARFKFNLKQPLPDDEETAMAWLRQAARSGQWRLIGGPLPVAAEWAIEQLVQEPDFADHFQSLELDEAEAAEALSSLGRLMVRHTRDIKSPRQRWREIPVEEQIDLTKMRDLARVYLEDVAQLKEMGFTRPNIAAYHPPRFWQQLLDTYQKSRCISMTKVRAICEKRPGDPVTEIEQVIELKLARQRGEAPPRPTPLSAAEKERFVANALRETRKRDHPYITPAMVRKIARAASSLEAAQKKLDFVRSEGVQALVAEYGDQVTPSTLQYCILHQEGDPEELDNYLDRVEYLEQAAKQAGGEVPLGYIRGIAREPGSAELSGEEVVLLWDAEKVRKNLAYWAKQRQTEVLVEPWAYEKIAQNYTEAERAAVAVSLNTLLQAGLVESALLSCALESEAEYENEFVTATVDVRTGKYYTFALKAIAQFNGDQQAILAYGLRLDYLLYGRSLGNQLGVSQEAATEYALAVLAGQQLPTLPILIPPAPDPQTPLTEPAPVALSPAQEEPTPAEKELRSDTVAREPWVAKPETSNPDANQRNLELVRTMEAGTVAAKILEGACALPPGIARMYGLANGALSDELRSDLEATAIMGAKARNQLIEANIGLARHLAVKVYRRFDLTDDERTHEGIVGLIRAADGYDYRRGNMPFVAFASTKIISAIRESVYTTGRKIKLPNTTERTISMLITTTRELRGELGREPTYAEISERVVADGAEMPSDTDYKQKKQNMTPKRVEELMVLHNTNYRSLESPVSPEDDADEFGDFIEDVRAQRGFNAVEAEMISAGLIAALDTARLINQPNYEELADPEKALYLTELEYEIIVSRFGIDGRPAETRAQIVERLQITPDIARKGREKALKKLQRFVTHLA